MNNDDIGKVTIRLGEEMFIVEYDSERRDAVSEIFELRDEIKRYRAAFQEILTLGNHVASALIGMGGLPNDYKTYTEALNAKGQPYADFWCAWSAIITARDAIQAKGGTQ